MRNPFSEKKWRKFQISRLFSSSSSAVKSHIIEVNLHVGETKLLDRWLVVLSMGSGQTRNMALDRYEITNYQSIRSFLGGSIYALAFMSSQKVMLKNKVKYNISFRYLIRVFYLKILQILSF